MREILFRGKDIKGIWHVGLLAHIGNAWYISNKAGISTAFEVIPQTIGQYTGLTDKNGVKIFEGDIVKHIDGLYDIGTVLYDEQTARYRRTSTMFPKTVVIAKSCVYEIIGNIHDNPELLKGGDRK